MPRGAIPQGGADAQVVLRQIGGGDDLFFNGSLACQTLARLDDLRRRVVPAGGVAALQGQHSVVGHDIQGADLGFQVVGEEAENF